MSTSAGSLPVDDGPAYPTLTNGKEGRIGDAFTSAYLVGNDS